ncbi:hypothetical protein MKW98_028267 [Papaver atlanticum]|uniref:Rapid ALkalinization Factor n=1 Tax=Papaver atlanticum TaxID=357466 RepID=A0AAD4SW34_9MAGN|nr:hypothetical protein MKW98_028267 [Papaver atlanticum]
MTDSFSKRKKIYLTIIFLQTHFLSTMGIVYIDGLGTTAAEGIYHHLQNELTMVKKACIGNRGLCFWESGYEGKRNIEESEEMEMDSEISRRVLMMQKKFISYETLKKDVIPCAQPGASYYNCHGHEANPYNRGCEVTTGCLRRGGHM